MERLLEKIGSLFDNPPYNTIEVCVGHYEDGEWIPDISLKDKESAYGYLFDRNVFGYEVSEIDFADGEHGHPLVFVTLKNEWENNND